MRKLGDFSTAGDRRRKTVGTRHGMEIAGLDARYLRELDSFFFAGWTREQLLGVLAIVDARQWSQNSNAEERMVPVVDSRTGLVTTRKKAVRSLNSIDWECARCRKSIVSVVGVLDADNLLCDVCLSRPGLKVASSEDPLIASSVRFTDACKKHIERRRKYILAAAVRNEKIRASSRKKP